MNIQLNNRKQNKKFKKVKNILTGTSMERKRYKEAT